MPHASPKPPSPDPSYWQGRHCSNCGRPLPREGVLCTDSQGQPGECCDRCGSLPGSKRNFRPPQVKI
jgi:hypothetical protein